MSTDGPASAAAGSYSTEARTLRGDTVRGIGWSGGASLAGQLVQFCIALVVTRLLLPEDYGLVAMLAVFAGLAALISEFGFGPALIQRRSVDQQHFTSVFWAQIAGGAIVAAAFVAASPLLADFYDETRLSPLAWLLAANFIAAGATTVHRAVLMRAMRFRTLAKIDLSASLIGGGTAILLAVLGAGPWSLVAQTLVNTSVTALFLALSSGWQPTWRFSWSALRELSAFARSLLAFNILNYGMRNTDNLLVGKYLGSGPLGLYARAYNILLFPVRQISGVVGKVMLASLSRIAEDHEKTRRVYLEALRCIALVTLPLMAGLALVSAEFVEVAFGSAWREAVPIIRIFCVVGASESLVTTFGWIYLSQGRTDLMFRMGILGAVGVLTGIGIGVAMGTVTTVAAGYAIASCLLTLPAIAVPSRLIGLRIRDVARSLGGTVACTGGMATAVLGLSLALPSSVPPAVSLLAKVATGVAVYGALVVSFRLPAVLDLGTMLPHRTRFLPRHRSTPR